MKILGIIPARYESSRFPGKPLVLLEGKTMVQRVYEQSKKSEMLDMVIVATDNNKIKTAVTEFGGNVLLTDINHQNGTSRCAETVDSINNHPKIDERFNYVINIQGDEPIINPKQIDELARLFSDNNDCIYTQVKKEFDLSLLTNPNIVKAILDENNFALDFLRVISEKEQLNNIQQNGFFYKHIGIYGFKTGLLIQLVELQPSENEKSHHLEQLRWLDNGFKIKTGITEYDSISIDSIADVNKVIEILKGQQS